MSDSGLIRRHKTCRWSQSSNGRGGGSLFDRGEGEDSMKQCGTRRTVFMRGERNCVSYFGRQRIVTRVHSFVTYGINRPTIILCGNDSSENESLGECCSLIKRHQAASLGVVGQLPRLIQSPFIPNQLSVEPSHRFQTKALSRGQQTKKETKRIERHQGAWMLEG